VKLSDRDLEDVFSELHMPEEGRALIREMRTTPPKRDPNTQINVTGRIASRKMEHAVRSESPNGETVAIREYESDPEVREFWDQALALTVPYAVPGTDRKTISHVPDFVVIRRLADGTPRIDVEEWRTQRRMEKFAAGDGARWKPTQDGDWTQVPVEEWLKERGIGYRIRIVGSIPPLRAANRRLLADYLMRPHPFSGDIVQRVMAFVTQRPGVSFAELLRAVDGTRVDDVLALIAFSVSGLSMMTLLPLSTSAAPKAQISHCVQPLSPVAWPSAMPPGVPLALSAWNIFRKPSVSLGKSLTPATSTRSCLPTTSACTCMRTVR